MEQRTKRIIGVGVVLGILALVGGSESCGLCADRIDAATGLEAGFRDPPKEARPTVYWLWLNGYVNREHVERELEALHDAGIRGICVFDMGTRGKPDTVPPAGPAFMSDEWLEHFVHAVRVAGRLGMDVQLSVASSWDMGGAWVEPQHASMGLFHSQVTVEGPASVNQVLPFPPIAAKAPRRSDGLPAFSTDVAVLAIPATNRLPGYDFIFKLDPPGLHTLDYAVLQNTTSDDPKQHGDLHLFTKDFAIAVSTTTRTDDAFREVLRASLKPIVGPQRFDVPDVGARYVRLRLLNGHNPRFERIQLGEFQLFNRDGINVVASHVADRSRDGAELLTYPPSFGHEQSWVAENIHDGRPSGPTGSWSAAGPPPLLIQDPASVIDLTERLDADGRLRWQAPPGRWVIQRFVCANTGERLKVPSPNSDGLATDHFSREATRVFLEYLIKRLQAKLGDLRGTALKQLYLASYEVRGATWTPDLIDQFRRYRGYDMKPYLPVLTGSTLANGDIAQRFLYDYRKTLGDLLVDAYYRAAVQSAHEAGLGIESEAGGPGPPIHQVPVDALKALGAIDEVRGEFWPRRPDADGMWVVKETACAAHIYGKRRVHMEAFTSMDHWQDSPFDLKPSADRVLCEGANHFVWHTSSHLPPEAGRPGWVYHAGTHLNPNLVWWPKAKPFLDYLARCSFLLQQGTFVGDVCYYYGDQGFNFVPPKRIDPSLGFGYDYDVTNAEVILERMSVRDGRIVLPDGISYAVLVLPDRTDIDLAVLKKLEQFVHEGATIIGPKPTRATGLADWENRDQEVRLLADRLWGPCDGKTVFEHAHGRGRIVWGRKLRDILLEHGIGPDFSFTSSGDEADIDFIHRRTEEADIYFVRNKRPQWEQIEGVFRVRERPTTVARSGDRPQPVFRAGERLPERWEPHSGRITPEYVFRTTPTGIAVPLRLEPYGAVFLVFRKTEGRPPAVQLTRLDVGHVSNVPGSVALRGWHAGSVPHADGVQVTQWDGKQIRLTASAAGRYRVTTGAGSSAEIKIDPLPAPVELDGPWKVRFPEDLGAPTTITLDKLISWTEHPNEGVRFFSGIATYRRSFELPADWLRENQRVLLDLGDLWAVGEVFVNGQSLGVLWKPPYVVDVTDAVRPGANELAIEVANTWSNRLVGDALSHTGKRYTRTNITQTGGRAWKDTPLLRSGLFGPVRLVPTRSVEATLKDAPHSQN